MSGQQQSRPLPPVASAPSAYASVADVVTDHEWLRRMFVDAERDLMGLPAWARPVVTPHSEEGLMRPTWDEQKDMAQALLASYPDPDDDNEYACGLRDGVNALLYREHPNGVEEAS